MSVGSTNIAPAAAARSDCRCIDSCLPSDQGTVLGLYEPMSQPAEVVPYDVVCVSHLRWNFVFQRPQHLLTRCAAERRVFYFEEPIYDEAAVPRIELQRDAGVHVVVPHLPAGIVADSAIVAQRQMLDQLILDERIDDFVLWYYTPMAVPFTAHLQPRTVIYDCMDELSAFAQAPGELRAYERQLLATADVVFTGGQSLYEAKRDSHPNVYALPSSVDVPHFAAARRASGEPEDQAAIPHPRLGYFGVIDERMDMDLLRGVATLRPAWH